MTGPEHFKAAEERLRTAKAQTSAIHGSAYANEAQVHALLALVAAVASLGAYADSHPPLADAPEQTQGEVAK